MINFVLLLILQKISIGYKLAAFNKLVCTERNDYCGYFYIDYIASNYL